MFLKSGPGSPGGFVRHAIGDWLISHHLASAAAVAGYERVLSANFDRIWPGVGLYLVLSAYWMINERHRADDRISEPSGSSLLHKLLVNLSMLLILLPIPGLTQRLLPGDALVLGLGLAVQLVGLIVAIVARRRLGRNWSSEVRLAVGHQLVTRGIYARLRHPIYTGVLLVSLGLAIQSGLVGAAIGFLVLALAYARKIPMEERLMSRAFGPEFEAYRRRSWAIVPFLY